MLKIVPVYVLRKERTREFQKFLKSFHGAVICQAVVKIVRVHVVEIRESEKIRENAKIGHFLKFKVAYDLRLASYSKYIKFDRNRSKG